MLTILCQPGPAVENSDGDADDDARSDNGYMSLLSGAEQPPPFGSGEEPSMDTKDALHWIREDAPTATAQDCVPPQRAIDSPQR